MKFRIEFEGGSGDLSDTQKTQFTEARQVSGSPIAGHYCQHIFEMKNFSGAFTTRERGLFGIHYINTTGGELDTTWINADFAAVETAVQNFFTTNAAYFSNQVRLVEHRWYPFGPAVVGANPPSRITTLTTPIPGTSTDIWIHQGATTITLRTSLRRHWGRIYLPITTFMYGVNGQMAGAAVTNVAGIARTMLLAAETSQGVVPVVWDRNRRIAFGITSIEADSVPDIIRRRRPRDVGARTVLTA